MSESWARAVRIGLEDQPTDLKDATQKELIYLWSDLEEAIRQAANGRWSMRCDWLTERIVALSRIVGVTPWGQAPLTLLTSGTYQGVLSAAGFTYPEPDMAKVQEMLASVRGSRI